MLTKKEKILVQPFIEQKYKKHRRKVIDRIQHATLKFDSDDNLFCAILRLDSGIAMTDDELRQVQIAQPAIDFARPSDQSHVLIKLKKIQKERERTQEIERENQRLLQRLSQIMSVNRLENYWKEPHPNFLNRVYIRDPQTRRRAQSVPARQVPPVQSTPVSQPSSSKSRSCMRCPTCSGRPERTAVKIPEPREPFPLPRKSWNYKIANDKTEVHRCCKLCC